MRYSPYIKSFLIIILFSLAIYSNSLINGFVYDDYFIVSNNILIRDFANLPKLFQESYFTLSDEETYRPVVTLTYFIDYALYGLSAWGYHLTNIGLHLVNGLLLYLFLTLIIWPSCLNPKPFFVNPPLMITLLFVTHPILTETVNAISYREDMLAFLFYIITLILYISLRSKHVNRPRSSVAAIYLLSCITYSLALFSKEMAVTLPAIILCYEWIYRDTDNKLFFRLFNGYCIGYIIIAIAYLYLQLHYLDRNGNAFKENIPTWGLPVRLQTVPWLLMSYLKLSTFPVLLSAEYKIIPLRTMFQMSFAIPLLAIISLLVMAGISSKKEKHIAFGILFFIISLTPVYGIVRITNPLAERYLYLPVVGFAVATGFIIYNLIKARTKALILFPIIVCLYSILVIERNGVWNSDYSLWTDTLKKQPTSARAHYNLGNIFVSKGDTDQAMYHFQEAVKLNKYHSDAHNNLGVIYQKKMRLEEAIAEFQLAIGWHPNEARYHNNLGVTYLRLGRLDEAISEFHEALSLKADYAAARNNLNQAYLAMGINEKAR